MPAQEGGQGAGGNADLGSRPRNAGLAGGDHVEHLANDPGIALIAGPDDEPRPSMNARGQQVSGLIRVQVNPAAQLEGNLPSHPPQGPGPVFVLRAALGGRHHQPGVGQTQADG